MKTIILSFAFFAVLAQADIIMENQTHLGGPEAKWAFDKIVEYTGQKPVPYFKGEAVSAKATLLCNNAPGTDDYHCVLTPLK